jgi:hypothetical protein
VKELARRVNLGLVSIIWQWAHLALGKASDRHPFAGAATITTADQEAKDKSTDKITLPEWAWATWATFRGGERTRAPRALHKSTRPGR